MTQGKKHMGGRRRYVKEQLNIPASRVGIKAKTPVVNKPNVKVAVPVKKTPTVFGGKSKPSKVPPSKTVFSKMGDQPTRAMFGLKPLKGGK